MKLTISPNSPFLFLSVLLENVSFCIQEESGSESAEADLATRLSLCAGVKLKLLKCHRENGNLVRKDGLILRHPESASPQ